MIKKEKLILLFFMALTFLATGPLCSMSHASLTDDLYAMSVWNNNIYKICTDSGTVDIVSSTALFPSIGIAADEEYLYYWNGDSLTESGLARWDPVTDTHTLITNDSRSEMNGAFDEEGTLWLLNRRWSFDPTIQNILINDVEQDLYTVNTGSGTRNIDSTLPQVGMGGFLAGDIAWGPDGKLYISTFNTQWKVDTVENYVWDPANPGAIESKPGVYYAGLAWIDDELYGSRVLDGQSTSGVFLLDPTDFSEISQVATLPQDVYIGDLTTAVIPEPATIFILGIGAAALLKRKK
jgi:hypothetical protein